MEFSFHQAYTNILREEIMPATGCTEPISIAFCAAKAHEVLGMQPTAATVSVSSSILKNVKSVTVPNTNGLKGIRASVAAGIVCGDASKGLQVISDVPEEQRSSVARFLESIRIDVSCAETECELYISVTLYARTSYARVVIANGFANIVEIMKNGEPILKRPIIFNNEENLTDRSCLNLHGIYTYADMVNLSEVRDLLDMQINYNTAICEEGLALDSAENTGRILLSENAADLKTIVRAYAAAGCFARMSGTEMPVATLCGSGNQGITASVPIICCAKYYEIPEERVYRALLISDLLTVYQNTWINKSSSYCAAFSAGCAAAAGIAYLKGGDETVVANTLVNALSMLPGSSCSGVHSSCPAKIASAVEIGILGYQMYQYRIRQGKDNTAPDADQAVHDIGRIVSDSRSGNE